MPHSSIRQIVRLVLGCALLSLAACSRTTVNPADEILKSMAGNWKVTSLNRNGKISTAGDLKEMTVSVEGDKFQFSEKFGPEHKTGDVSVRAVAREEYVVQVNAEMKGEIDFVFTTGQQLGQSRPGLYTLEGSTWTICLAAAGKPRPSTIAPGSEFTVFALERQP